MQARSVEHRLTTGGGTALAKIRFPLGLETWHGYSDEYIWAANVGNGLYDLQNTPFFINGVSYRDCVHAVASGNEIVFARVHSRGGHSTYRIAPKERSSAPPAAWRRLHELGCTYEEMRSTNLYAMDVPASADIYEVDRLLTAGLQDGAWDFQEGHCGHELRRGE